MAETEANEITDYVRRIENVLEEMDSEKSKYMSACKEFREDIAEIYAEAKNNGTSKAALRAVIKTRSLERKLEDVRKHLDLDEQDLFDRYRLALGDLADTPLGQAAQMSFRDQLEADEDESKPKKGLGEAGDISSDYKLN